MRNLTKELAGLIFLAGGVAAPNLAFANSSYDRSIAELFNTADVVAVVSTTKQSVECAGAYGCTFAHLVFQPIEILKGDPSDAAPLATCSDYPLPLNEQFVVFLSKGGKDPECHFQLPHDGAFRKAPDGNVFRYGSQSVVSTSFDVLDRRYSAVEGLESEFAMELSAARATWRPLTQDDEKIQGMTMVSPVYFQSGESGQDTLEDSLQGRLSESALYAAMSVMTVNSKVRWSIIGFADEAECSATECAELARKRAESVRGWLLGKGVAPLLIAEAISGDVQQAADVARPEDDSFINRRVEFRPIPGE
jgi:hypothetical protein